MVGRLISFWETLFSGAMLVAGRVHGRSRWHYYFLEGEYNAVDGSEIRRENHLSLVVYPIIYRVSKHPRGLAGYLNHQQMENNQKNTFLSMKGTKKSFIISCSGVVAGPKV